MKNSSKFFQNRDCEYFPCHKAVKEDEFNCMFCYCPLYLMGDKCGGGFTFTPGGIKDCSNCMKPHEKDSWDYMTGKLKECVFKNE